YIDQDETQIYGPHAARYLRSHVVGLVPKCDDAIKYFADEIDHATEAVGAQIAAARAAESGVRKHAREKRSPLDSALSLLGRFSTHLDTHKDDGAFDRKDFFVKDGTAKGVGKAGGRVLVALTHIQGELAKKTCKVDNKSKWLAEFQDAAAELAPALEHAATATTDRRSLTPEVEAARTAWLVAYKSAKDVATGVLRAAGRLDLLNAIFYDLVVPSGAKVAAIPPVPPAPAPAPPDAPAA
ncbi:MAG TPA: hypothetical protein VHB21_11330, partial [Minicystis sp.]|nr:hypothetical protein [Minicystis sp.]